MLSFPFAPHHAWHPAANYWSDLGEPRKLTVFFGLKNSTDFSRIPKILRARFRCMTSFTSPGHISIWDFYFDISELHILPARARTPALILHQTNPCAKRKILSLTKPKGKINKTKSLGHYITSGHKAWQEFELANGDFLVEHFSYFYSKTPSEFVFFLFVFLGFFFYARSNWTWMFCKQIYLAHRLNIVRYSGPDWTWE